MDTAEDASEGNCHEPHGGIIATVTANPSIDQHILFDRLVKDDAIRRASRLLKNSVAGQFESESTVEFPGKSSWRDPSKIVFQQPARGR
jgi:hypothetical protein